jgi:type II secretory ATPase GspE/PulE/Tfp pilus assembly ATPase PilB-like protein
VKKAVIHINKENKIGFTLESLGFFGKNLNKIHRIIQKKNGIILVTGPTNSGKTTLLYTMLDMINESHLNIATIEDPIEYQLPYINQTQINPEIGLNFPNGLRSILKQDPDIIMVGEIRDEETANIVFNASLNGRLILSTIHSNSLVNTIERLQQIKIPKFLLTTNLKMIINQRLVRRLNVDKEKYHMTDTELIELSKNIDLDKMLNILKEENIIGQYQTWRDVDFYRPNPNIPETDQYKGQIIISEILEMDEIIKDAILTGTPTKTLENTIKGQNMSLLENGIIMSIKGETSIDEVFRVINQT